MSVQAMGSMRVRVARWLFGVACAGLMLAGGASEVDTTGTGDGAACGEGVTCGSEEYCCDPTCGLCVAAEVAGTETCAP